MAISKFFIAISIAIIFALFVGYGVSILFENPRYYYEQNDCYLKFQCERPLDKCNIKELNLSEQEYNYFYQECYTNYTLSKEYINCQKEREICEINFMKNSQSYKNARNSFFLLISLGMIAIIFGIKFSNLEGISNGFIGGGILIIIWAVIFSWQYWFSLGKYIKLFVLGLLLVILIYIGYKKLDNLSASNTKNTKIKSINRNKLN